MQASDACVRLQMCVELVIAVALRNRDRLLLIWPTMHDFLAAILAPAQVHCTRCRAQDRPVSGLQSRLECSGLFHSCSGLHRRGQGYLGCCGLPADEPPSSRAGKVWLTWCAAPAGEREAGSDATGGTGGPGAAAGMPAPAAVQAGDCGRAAQIVAAAPALEPCSRMGPCTANSCRGEPVSFQSVCAEHTAFGTSRPLSFFPLIHQRCMVELQSAELHASRTPLRTR